MPRVNTGLKEKDFQDGKLVKTDIDGKSFANLFTEMNTLLKALHSLLLCHP